MDEFARESAAHAHKRITELAHTVRLIQQALTRRAQHTHRCMVCGDPIRAGAAYCTAHQDLKGTR